MLNCQQRTAKANSYPLVRKAVFQQSSSHFEELFQPDHFNVDLHKQPLKAG
jgi:hypothetical protein